MLVGVALLTVLGAAKTYSQETEPSFDLPVVDSTATATATVEAYSTITPTSYATATSTSEVNTISAEDEAETGAEVYILAGLSLVAGFGIYFIKKYLDIKRYSI